MFEHYCVSINMDADLDTNIEKALENMSKNRWELVSTITIDRYPNQLRMFWKRPLQQNKRTRS